MSSGTLVFFDLESTGLPTEYDVPKIVSLAMLSVPVPAFVEISRRQSNLNNCRPFSIGELQNEFPGQIRQLDFVVNPKKRMHWKATEVNGFSDEQLSHFPAFDPSYVSKIDLFLAECEKPVYLVAQHGMDFDFPLLKLELESIGSKLEEETMLRCVDSWDVIYKFETTTFADEVELCLKKALENRVNKKRPSRLSQKYSYVDPVVEADPEFPQRLSKRAWAVTKE